MLISPSKDKFIKAAKIGKLFPVYTELPFMPPQQIYESVKSPYSFLLESIKGPEKIARYSFIGSEPFLIFKVKDGIVEVEDRSQELRVKSRESEVRSHNTGIKIQPSAFSLQPSKAPLKVLKKILTAYKVERPADLPPFIGGEVGLISYDFVHYFENLPKTAVDDIGIPDAHFLLVDTVIAVDHKLRKTFIMSCPTTSAEVQKCRSAEAQEWGNCYEKACEKIYAAYEKIKSVPQPSVGAGLKPAPTNIHIHHEMGKVAYMDIVRRAKEYIKAGDIFQANLSQRVSAHIDDIDPWQVYKILRNINPSPFAAYLDMGDYYIASSSPERLIRVSGKVVETRPIAGTRPRGKDAKGDHKMRTELLLNEKERAEHLMLIDLERNDLGKISDYSTVEVDEFMITEDYSHVIHIVSNIKGSLAGGKDCFDAVRAAFPGGTITGVPKVRCMEIIDELEPVARGPYTGSIGYISFTGDMDLNIIIRTFVIKDKTAYVQAGAGIVADSDPEKEYYETLKKAEALIKTLEVL
ncbi:MAG: anthranilate synthase component I family protein [Nitrospirae bacterium]|nr:anthranilate synthase component I family protein [Nitrospirota bacterium]